MANKQKISEIVVNNVLAFVKPFASKALQKDISALLHPCCKPLVEITTSNCSTCGGCFVKFTNVVITDTTLRSTRVTAILEDIVTNGGGITQFSFDAEGVWTGDITTNVINYPSNSGTFTLTLIPDGFKVARVSDPVVVTGISNCN